MPTRRRSIFGAPPTSADRSARGARRLDHRALCQPADIEPRGRRARARASLQRRTLALVGAAPRRVLRLSTVGSRHGGTARRRSILRRNAPPSYQDGHISLGVIYANRDMVRSWSHHDLARGLGFTGAAERLDGLEKSMTKNEMVETARSLSQTMRRDLKPLPMTIEIQDTSASRPEQLDGPPARRAGFVDELRRRVDGGRVSPPSRA